MWSWSFAYGISFLRWRFLKCSIQIYRDIPGNMKENRDSMLCFSDQTYFTTCSRCSWKSLWLPSSVLWACAKHTELLLKILLSQKTGTDYSDSNMSSFYLRCHLIPFVHLRCELRCAINKYQIVFSLVSSSQSMPQNWTGPPLLHDSMWMWAASKCEHDKVLNLKRVPEYFLSTLHLLHHNKPSHWWCFWGWF